MTDEEKKDKPMQPTFLPSTPRREPAGPYGSHPTDAFFPASVRASVRRWYGKHLIAMGEPSLFQYGAARDAVRLLWLRAFDKPIAIRIERAEEGLRLTATRLNGEGTHGPGTIDHRRERDVSESDWRRLLDALATADFENMPVDTGIGFDGALWILERVLGGQYHMVQRRSPGLDGPYAGFRRSCDLLVEFGGPCLVDGKIY